MGNAQNCGYDDSCCANQNDQKKKELDLGTSPGHTRLNSVYSPDHKLQGAGALTAIAPVSTNLATLHQTTSPRSPKEQFRLDRVSSRSRTLGECNAVNQAPEALPTPYPSTEPGDFPVTETWNATNVRGAPAAEFFAYFGNKTGAQPERPNNFPMSADFSRAVSPRKLEVLQQAGGFNFHLDVFPGRENDTYYLQSADEQTLYFGQGRCKSGMPADTAKEDLFSQVVKEGQGYLWVKNSILFAGYFSEDIPNGPGILIYKDDSYFLGIWDDGKLNGYGIFHSVDAKVYRGYWKDNLQEGEGEEIWLATGTTYCGKFLGGKRHGQGTLFLAEEGSVYKGSFHENKFCGHGTYKWASGDVYTGQWLDDKMDGKGTFTWVDGRSYHGEYVNGFKDGFGVFTWKDGRRYEGLWKQGRPNGQGTFTDSSGTKSSGAFGDGLLSLKQLSGRPPKIPRIR